MIYRKISDVTYINQDSLNSKLKIDYINYLDTSNITKGKIDNIQRMDIKDAPSRAKRIIKRNDIVYSTVRPNLCHYGIIRKPVDMMVASTGFAVLTAKLNYIFPEYLYAYLTLQTITDRLHAIAETSTSTYPSIKPSDIGDLIIPVPDLRVQERIGSVLSIIDRKIELNSKLNDNLEELAKTQFKEWFIKYIEKEDIPTGWEYVELGQLIDIIDNRGKTPQLEVEKTEYPIIDVKALSGDSRIVNFENCTKYVSKDTYDNWFRSGHPLPLDILISTVGSLAEMKIFNGNVGCIAQNVVAFRCKVSPYYLYQYLKEIKNDLISYNIGSVQPSIKVTHIVKHKILIPSNEVVARADYLLSNITEQIYANCKQIDALKKLRDNLLPKLMSGEIDLDDFALDV